MASSENSLGAMKQGGMPRLAWGERGMADGGLIGRAHQDIGQPVTFNVRCSIAHIPWLKPDPPFGTVR